MSPAKCARWSSWRETLICAMMWTSPRCGRPRWRTMRVVAAWSKEDSEVCKVWYQLSKDAATLCARFRGNERPWLHLRRLMPPGYYYFLNDIQIFPIPTPQLRAVTLVLLYDLTFVNHHLVGGGCKTFNTHMQRTSHIVYIHTTKHSISYHIELYYIIYHHGYILFYSIIYCYIIFFFIFFYYILSYYILFCYIILNYCILYYIMFYYIIFYYIIFYFVTLYYITLWYIILHSIILCFIILYNYMLRYFILFYDIILS